MFKFLLIIIIIIYIIYKASTLYVKFFVNQSIKNFKKKSKKGKKGILDEEGDFVDYEEVD